METKVESAITENYNNVTSIRNENNQTCIKYKEEISSLKEYNVRLS